MKDYKFCPICGNPLRSGVFNGKRRDYCPKCGFINYKNPLPSVGAIAVMGGKILLVKRKEDPGKGMWAPPCGFIESGETPEDACLRELKEETGVVGKIKRLIGVFLENAKIYEDVIIIMYLVSVSNGEITAGDEVVDAKFFRREELPDFRHNCFKEAINDVLDEI